MSVTAAAPSARETWTDLFVGASDGVRLHVREYGPRTASSAVVCLPGLARTTADFHELATALAAGPLHRDDIGSKRSNVMNVIDSNVLERDYREKPAPTFSHPAPDHDDIGSKRSNVMNVIDSNVLERDYREKPVPTFSHPAPGRRVLAIDSRGRGLSDRDHPARYTLPVELADVIAVLTALEVARAVFIGTSRGGLLTMLLAAARPGAIAGAVLNDIGPVIDAKGLMRIKGYVGRLPQPRTMQEAAETLRRLGSAQFPNLSAADWLKQAERTFTAKDHKLALAYDPRLSRTFSAFDPEQPVPTLWPQFDALAHAPVMVIRGGNSDILSAATVDAMRARRPDLEVMEVADQGHAPLLTDEGSIGRIGAFVAACEACSR